MSLNSTNNRLRSVLIVEDDDKIRANLIFQVRDAGYQPTAVPSAETAFVQLRDKAHELPELLLLDVRLPGLSGVELVRSLAGIDRLPATIIVSGEASITETVTALKLGVHDFIEKPFSKERLLRSMRNTLETAALKLEVETLRSALEPRILGTSSVIEKMLQLIERAAPTDARVLICGESGTGKELVADALHRQSPRHGKPFIKLNCAAVPEQLIEDELFGHVKGAFTDARGAKPGLFEEADGGTLFLDEIGDMGYQLQARLLRVLEDGRVRRVGDTQDRAVDVRVLAATHRDLLQTVADGAFREDLYFRLAALPIDVPALREREGDLRLLFLHFLDHFSRHHRMRPRQVAEPVFGVIKNYAWPGNVRELRNVCERLVVFGCDPVTLDQLPPALFADGRQGDANLLRLEQTFPPIPLRELKTRVEREYIESVLQRARWNFTATARQLGIQRTYLHQKVNTLGISRPENGVEAEG